MHQNKDVRLNVECWLSLGPRELGLMPDAMVSRFNIEYWVFELSGATLNVEP